MTDQCPPPLTRGDKKALVKLLIKLKLATPIHCIYLCEYAGIADDCNLCLNPEVYFTNSRVKITYDLVISCSLPTRRVMEWRDFNNVK